MFARVLKSAVEVKKNTDFQKQNSVCLHYNLGATFFIASNLGFILIQMALALCLRNLSLQCACIS